MNEMIRIINDADELFDDGPSRDFASGQFYCPVCKKYYKSEAGVKKHMKKRDCINYHSLFENTTTEMRAYKLFVALINEVNPNARVSIQVFRKSTSYNSVMRFLSFLLYHNGLHLCDMYIAWIIEMKNATYINKILKLANDLKRFEEFKVDVHAFDLMSPEAVKKNVDQSIEQIREDNGYLLRLIENCKIPISAVFIIPELEEIADNLPAEYKIRLQELMDKVINRRKKENV